MIMTNIKHLSLLNYFVKQMPMKPGFRCLNRFDFRKKYDNNKTLYHSYVNEYDVPESFCKNDLELRE